MQNKVYRKVIPFDDAYYFNCKRILRLTAMRYFSGEPLKIMINDILVHDVKEKSDKLSMRTVDHYIMSNEEVYQQLGICYECENIPSEGILDKIRDALGKDHLIIAPANGKYYKHPFHDLFYGIKDHAQSFLVNGYDDETEKLKIIDVNGMEWEKHDFCYEYEISYEEFLSCYKGILEYASNKWITRVEEFSRVPDFEYKAKERMKDELLHNFWSCKDLILEGIEKIKDVADHYEKFDMDTTDAFNNKVSAHSVWYMCKSLFGEQAECVPLLHDVVMEWDNLEYSIYKYMMEEKFRKMENIQECFQKIYETESKAYASIFRM